MSTSTNHYYNDAGLRRNLTVVPRQGIDTPLRWWNTKQGEHAYTKRGRVSVGREGLAVLRPVRFAVEWVNGAWYWTDMRRVLDGATMRGPFVTSAVAWWDAKQHFKVSVKHRSN